MAADEDEDEDTLREEMEAAKAEVEAAAAAAMGLPFEDNLRLVASVPPRAAAALFSAPLV